MNFDDPSWPSWGRPLSPGAPQGRLQSRPRHRRLGAPKPVNACPCLTVHRDVDGITHVLMQFGDAVALDPLDALGNL